MINYSSIKYISSLLNNPETITAGDQSSIALFRQTFPYFVPVRYLAAVESNKMNPWSPSMQSEIQPYLGDWILFGDFLENGNKVWNGESKPGPVPANKVLDKKKIELVHTEIIDTQKEETAKPVIPIDKLTNPEADKKVNETKQAPPAQQEEQPKSIFAQVSETNNETLHPTPAIAEAPQQPVVEGTEEEGTQPISIFTQVAELLNESEATGNEAADNVPTTAEAPTHNEQVEEEALPVIEVTGAVVEITDIEVQELTTAPETKDENNDLLISPVYTQDYFLQQGEKISEDIPDEIADLAEREETDEDKSLMVMMSFSEWLLHFKNTSQKQQEERKDQKALKTMWQKEKLAAALEEENEEIPENVFQMAVNSIAREEGLASETLAEIYIKQSKYDQAIEMYRKLSLQNPQKSTYFARKIEDILKEK